MKVHSQSETLNGLHQFNVHSNHDWQAPLEDYDEIILLLHGYSETGFKIYKRLGHKLAESFASQKRKALILAPNGLYPLPKSFPLGQRPPSEDLLMGFAWYFFDATTNTFLIDYKVPQTTLSSWLEDINPKNLPVTIIGYSQGGYLAPFVGFSYKKTKEVIGINCSFREDLFPKTPSFPLTQFQGRKDTIIETDLSYKRYKELEKKGASISFHWVEEGDHRLGPETANAIVDHLSS